MSNLSSPQKIHFVGIGGIGVSALAQWFLSQGASVSGSNLSHEPIIPVLEKQGAMIRVGEHRAENVPHGTELLVYTLAAPADNPERREARRRGIPEMSYPEAVGGLTKQKFTIAVCGSHGKSTTAAMAALMLVKAGYDPTVILGTRLKAFKNTNFRYGASKYLVIEADEWRGAFWHYRPQIVILTNIDREHLDFYKTFRGVKNGFKKFLEGTPPDACLIANGDDPATREVVIDAHRMHIFYSLRDPDADAIRQCIKIPGEHNVSNALAILALARILKISRSVAMRTIEEYRGAWRRFEYRGILCGAKLFDDYAHHPTEIKATLQAARTMLGSKGRLWCVFQPHQYRRLKALFPAFAAAFDLADQVLILPVYAVAGRDPSHLSDAGAKRLARALRKRGLQATYAATFSSAAKTLRQSLRKGDICILMGAGDIVRIHEVLHTT